jgi:hypothetical protein
MIEIVGGDLGLGQTIGDGVFRKRSVMLPAGKTLLLRRGDDPSVIDRAAALS